jgi:hypothetical protein
MNRKMFVGVVGALALALAACGGSSNPASPSSPPGTTASVTQSGATISGSVNGATSGTAAGYQKLDATNGVTVSISGTNVSVAVDSQGRFTFTGVPAGTVTLVFTAAGATATVTLTGVQASDSISIKVTLKGATATLDDEQRNGSTMTELEDQVAAINPEGTSRTLLVGGTRVSVPTTAIIRHGDATTPIDFTALKVGDRVHVRGSMAGAVMTATEVMVQNTNSNPGVNASGTVTAVAARSCPAVEFTVGGWTVTTNASTDFQKVTCATLAVGSSVHVKGTVQQPTGKVLATWVQGK